MGGYPWVSGKRPVNMAKTLAELMQTLPQVGRIEWIGLRPARNQPMLVVDSAELSEAQGIIGDRFQGRPGGDRQVTLIQSEHLQAIGAFTGQGPIDPARLRRNIVVSGVNLLALKDRTFYLGEVKLEFTGLAHPCSKMEVELGAGGYNAMRGHGGITARILVGGKCNVGDQLVVAGE